eukprot:scaffold31897_cov58-Phaeocystis_antarctica.AAC.7
MPSSAMPRILCLIRCHGRATLFRSQAKRDEQQPARQAGPRHDAGTHTQRPPQTLTTLAPSAGTTAPMCTLTPSSSHPPTHTSTGDSPSAQVARRLLRVGLRQR